MAVKKRIKSKFYLKVEILVKNRIFLSKTEIFVKNLTYCQKYKILPKICQNLGQKSNFVKYIFG